MTPEIEKAVEDTIKLNCEYIKADRNFYKYLGIQERKSGYSEKQYEVQLLLEQLDETYEEEEKNKLIDQFHKLEAESQEIYKTIESQQEYEILFNYREEAREKSIEAQNTLNYLIEEEAENDARN
jgi:hypothetical protein